MRIDTVVATYNRKHTIDNTIDSILKNVPQSLISIVDDCSTDGTCEHLRSKYADQLDLGLIRIYRLEANSGVTGAKNFGFLQSTADWVIFLDSDDEYVEECGDLLLDELTKHSCCPVVFFRCQDQSGNFVGRLEHKEVILDLSTYIEKTSYGEALTEINRTMIGKVPPYVASLRGYEGIGCSRLICQYGAAILSKHKARIYDTSSVDRLSISQGFYNRSLLLARGHFMMVSEFSSFMSMKTIAAYLFKSLVYFSIGKVYSVVGYFK